eukprot:1061088-Amphidinium_carterae.2
MTWDASLYTRSTLSITAFHSAVWLVFAFSNSGLSSRFRWCKMVGALLRFLLWKIQTVARSICDILGHFRMWLMWLTSCLCSERLHGPLSCYIEVHSMLVQMSDNVPVHCVKILSSTNQRSLCKEFVTMLWAGTFLTLKGLALQSFDRL